MSFYYQLNENDSLAFRPVGNNGCCFDLYSKGEATAEMKIAHYQNNKWMFDDEHQRSLFMKLMLLDRNGFQKAFKNYFRSFQERPSVWECAWRRFNIKVTKTKRKITESFYGGYTMREI
jgi:hypothetical protein